MSTSRGSEILRALPGAARRAVPKLRQLTLAEMALLLQAPVALPAAAFALRRWGLATVQTWIARRTVRAAAPDTDEARLATAQRLSWCVQVAAAYGPWPANCLQRSVVLCWFLHRRGLHGDLRIGVRNTDQGALDFHAWVEYAGMVVNDRRDVAQRYAVFDRAITPVGARFT